MTAGMALFVLDALLVAIAWPLSVLLAGGHAVDWRGWVLALPYPALYLLLLYAFGLYRRDALIATARALSRLPLVLGLAALAATIVSKLLRWAFDFDGYVSLQDLFVAAILGFAICGMAARLLFRLLRYHHFFRPRLLVIGAGERAWDLLFILEAQGRNLQYDVTFVHDAVFGPIDPRLSGNPSNRIIEAGTESLLQIAERTRADRIVVAPDERRGMALDGLIACKTAGFPVEQYMGFLEQEARRIDMKRLDVGWLLYSDGFSAGPLDRILKRLLDIVASLLILFIFLPFLLVAMAAVWLGDRGPVFYRQQRVTRGGRLFRIRKLRTMRIDAEARGAVWAAKADSRITPVGNFLRRSRLDELPQLINVLSGEMSLVGPRPERPEFTGELAEKLPLYNERHAVKAGLTGWAQINYPYGASLDDARSKLSYDLYYVKNFSIGLDLLILLQTLRVVFWPSGVR